MAHFHDNALVGASGQGGYQISRSLRFNSADSAYLNRTPASAGNRRTWTWSAWVKRGNSSNSIFSTNSSDNLSYNYFGFSSDSFRLYQWNGSGYDFQLITTAVFRDQSAWYHFVISVDTTQATAGNRVRFYVNGVEVTAFSTNTTPSQNLDTYVNSSSYSHLLGRNPGGSSTYFDGYLTEINFIDGQALTPSSFGETDTITGVWKPKKYAGTYGTNGFYLNFSDNSGTTSITLGKDSSGNSNNWTPNNFSVTAGAGNDSLIDTPTPYADGGNGRGNYCTLNPLISNALGYLIPAINGNLEVSVAAGSNAFFGQAGTQAITSGKFYWEVTPTAIATSAGTWMEVGIIQSALAYPSSTAIGAFNGGFAYTNDGLKGRSATYSAYGATWTTNDVIGVALDADGGSITFYKNGVSQGAAYTDLTNYSLPAGYYPAIAIYRNTGITQSAVFNFGQRPFAYTPPSGFVALNTQNLPEPSIKKPGGYMDVVTYTGNGAASGRNISTTTNPDLVWIKSRSINTGNHFLFDSVRGATNVLGSNQTIAEYSNSDFALGTGQFTVGDNGGSDDYNPNKNAATYVAWCWDESATPGFDIVTYTGTGVNGQLINHNLGVTPSMIMYKCRDTPTGPPGNWIVWHKSISQSFPTSTTFTATGFTGALLLNSTSGSLTYSYDNQIGESGKNYVAYLWSEVAGFSKFGSYTGNGSTDGPFVFCNFRPRWVMVKRTDSTGDWWMWDSARNTYNVVNNQLYANSSTSEAVDSWADLLSNGFKIRNTYGANNASGGTYVYAAFSESPFKYSLAR